jgi:signal transduction histidine kinase
VLSFANEIAAAPVLAADGEHVYRHRFGEPFDSVTASVALAPLGGGSGAGTVYGLAALLAVTGIAGLFAVHRMVTVAMAYAERRSNFVAAVTHELKTPLTAIRMYGEMLRDDLVPSDAKRQEYYRTITAESERLSRLIDNVLEFSRLEKGTREMRLVVGPIGPVVEEVAALLRPHAEREGFTLRTDVARDLPSVRFERDALFQVLLNLVDNALKYARCAVEREITIECRRVGAGVAVAVRDHGPGVAPRHLGRIFEPFHRGEDELVRTTQGTGLGLALVESLVARMGGAVSGRNAPDGGFEVCVELPAANG